MTNEEIAVELKAVEERCKSNTHRIDELAKNQEALNQLTASVGVLAEKQDNLTGDVGEIKADVKALMGKGGKRWDGIVDKVLLLVIGAVIAYILAHVGL